MYSLPDMKSLTLDQKMGQLFMARTPKLCALLASSGMKISEDDVFRLLEKGLLTGFYTGRDITPSEIDHYQKRSPIPLLIATDIETGAVAQDMRSVTPLPMQMALAAINDEKAVYESASIAARETLAQGINFAFGPVADLAVDPRSTLVGLRSFGSDADRAARFAAAAIRGYQDNGIMVSLKHYPGFGGSPFDAHIRMNVLALSKAQFMRRELSVYKKIMKRVEVSGIMSGHILVPSIDRKNCATTSGALVRLLREAGFEGVLITDSLAMKGLKLRVDSKYAHQRSLASGHDIILSDYNVHPETALQYIREALEEGLITEETIERSVERIWRAKRRIFSFRARPFSRGEHMSASLELSRRSITVRGRLPRLDRNGKILFITAEEFDRKQVRGELILDTAYRTAPEEALGKAFPNAKFVRISECPDAGTIEKTLDLAVDYRDIVMIAYSYPGAYKGNSHLSRPLIHFIDALHERIRALVFFGLPYALNDLLMPPECVVFGYLGGFFERAAFDALLRERGAPGRLPVKIRG